MSIRHFFDCRTPAAGVAAPSALALALALAVTLILGVSFSAVAQTTPTLSLAQALQAARNNLDVSLARRVLAAAQGDVLAADHAPAPIVIVKASSIDLQNGIGGGNLFSQKRIDKSIGVDWTWERGNKRELRTAAAQRSAAAAQSDIDEIILQQQLAAASGYFDLLAVQERIGQIEAIARSAGQLADTAARRVKAGDLAAQEQTRLEIEAQRAATDLLTAQLDRKRAAAVLAQYTGYNGANMLVARTDWPNTLAADAASEGNTLYPAVDARPDVRAALQRFQAARTALDLAETQKKADLTLGTTYDHFPGTSNRLLELRLQMPLYGVLGGYNFQGEIARSQAQLDQAEDQLEKTRRMANADLTRLQQDRQGAAARALSYEATILPRARKVAEMAELAYSKGAMSLTELIDARRTLRTILLEGLAARTDHAKAAQAWLIRQP